MTSNNQSVQQPLAVQILVGMFNMTETEARRLLRRRPTRLPGVAVGDSEDMSPLRQLIEDGSADPQAADVVLAALEECHSGSVAFNALLEKLTARGLLLPGADATILEGVADLGL